MAKSVRVVLTLIGTLLLLVVVAAVSLPLLLNAENFRTRIQSALSKSLGRQVAIQKMQVAVLSGGLVAQGVTVADDPRFSQEPFIRADQVKIGIEVLPLLLHRQVQVRSFALDAPSIQLLRATGGTWNYSSLGNSSVKNSEDAETRSTFPNLTVGSIDVNNGRITVGTQTAPGSSVPTQPNRTYDSVTLAVKNFGFANSFAFEASAKLPGDGSVSASGSAGPINQQDTAATPYSGHLELKHVDPLASGFVDASDGVSGLVESLVVDATWSGQELHVTKLLVDTPHLAIVRSNTPKPPTPVPKRKAR